MGRRKHASGLRLLAVTLILMATSAGAAEIKPFARDDMASDAVRLMETLRIATAAIGAQVKDKTPDQLRKEAAAASAASKFAAAEKLAGAAITAAPKDPANWLAYVGVAIKADDAKANNRYELVTRGSTAAYAAYLRSTTPDAQAAALAVLADLLARHEMWRPALDAFGPTSIGATRSTCARPTRPCAPSTAFAFSTTRSTMNRPRRASVSIFPSRSRARPILRPMSRSPGRPIRRSRTRTSRSASRASSTASATQSCCAKACPRRSGSSC